MMNQLCLGGCIGGWRVVLCGAVWCMVCVWVCVCVHTATLSGTLSWVYQDYPVRKIRLPSIKLLYWYLSWNWFVCRIKFFPNHSNQINSPPEKSASFLFFSSLQTQIDLYLSSAYSAVQADIWHLLTSPNPPPCNSTTHTYTHRTSQHHNPLENLFLFFY